MNTSAENCPIHIVILGVEGQVYGVRAFRDVTAALGVLGEHLMQYGAPGGDAVTIAKAYQESRQQAGSDPHFGPSGMWIASVEGPAPERIPELAAPRSSVPRQAVPPRAVPGAPLPQGPYPPGASSPPGSHPSFSGARPGDVPEIREGNVFSGGGAGQVQGGPANDNGSASVATGPGLAGPPGAPPTPSEMVHPGVIAIGQDVNGWGLCVSGRHLGYFDDPQTAIDKVREYIPARVWPELSTFVVDGQNILRLDLCDGDPLNHPTCRWPIRR
jgi:hypothetical protein